MTTRLEGHRSELEAAGYLGPLIRLEELDEDELRLINRTFLERCRRLNAVDIGGIYRAYVETLHEWGVMCPHPHPQPQRAYEGWFRSDCPQPFEDHRWYDCNLCGSAVINR